MNLKLTVVGVTLCAIIIIIMIKYGSDGVCFEKVFQGLLEWKR